MTTNTRCVARRRLVPRLGMLALLVAVTAFAGDAWAGWSTPISPMPPLDDPGDMGEPTTPPTAPIDAQACFDKWLSNAARCKQLYCHWFLWIIPITICDSPEYSQCLEKAGDVYNDCMHPGGNIG